MSRFTPTRLHYAPAATQAVFPITWFKQGTARARLAKSAFQMAALRTSGRAGAPPPRPRLALALQLLVLLAAAGGAAAQTKKFKPPASQSAAPITLKVGNLRTAAAAVSKAWKAQPVSQSYASYLTALRKPPSNAANTTRQALFNTNLASIMAVNNNTKLKWTAAPNGFTDLTPAERAKRLIPAPKRPKRANLEAALRATRLSLRQLAAMEPPEVTISPQAMAEAAVAHRAAGTVGDGSGVSAASVTPAAMLTGTPDWSSLLPGIKDQGGCQCCWAFAVTALMEAGHYTKTGAILPLSEKQLLDCASDGVQNKGCLGGWYTPTFDYLIKAGGQCTGNDYPFVAMQSTCPAQLPAFSSKLKSYQALPPNDEAAILAALQDGPVGVAMTAPNDFYDYAGGVYSSTACTGDVNHAVVIVGAGVDDDTNTPYWLIRNSWGSSTWGEGGYGRILRGVGGAGMCNIAAYAFSITSGDGPTPPPPPPPPAPGGCTATTVTADDTGNLIYDLAGKYNLSIAQIMIDNGLAKAFDKGSGPGGKFVQGKDKDPVIKIGTKLKLNCPNGTWSPPIGAWDDSKYQGMMAAPIVNICPPGTYVVEIYAKPSMIDPTDDPSWTAWIGAVSMTCSNGVKMSVDAMPNVTQARPDGTQTQMNGFTTVQYRSGWAVDSLIGIGDITGDAGNYTCPPDTVITGFSAGSGVEYYSIGRSLIDTLQFFCSNPFKDFFPASAVASVGAIRKLKAAAYPRLKAKLSCKAVPTLAGDTWFTLAARYSTASFPIAYYDVIRANPNYAGTLPAGASVFIPPCNNGMRQTVRSKSALVASAAPAGVQAVPSVEVAPWDSSTPEGRAAWRAAFNAQPSVIAAKAAVAAVPAAAAAAAEPADNGTDEQAAAAEPAAPAAGA